MNTLFISTYSENIIIGLLKNGKLISKKEHLSNRSHSIYTVPLIEEILNINNLEPKDLNEIIVIDGPGSFTGVRLGITVAKTLAYTLNIPIKCISSIEAVGINTTGKKIITIKDPKGYYVGLFNNSILNQDILYLSSKEYEEYKTKYNDYEEYSSEELDINKIYEYTEKIDSVNPHGVKARYIKGIEALNDR